MSEDRLKELIQGYVSAEMELLPDPESLPEHPPYSRRFNKKMKRIKRAGDYFGGNLRVYTTLSRVAAAILIVLCLVAANQASAAIFGFNPWQEITKGIDLDIGMEEKTYKKKDVDAENMKKPVSDFPTYVPVGYKLVDCQVGQTFSSKEWHKMDEGSEIIGIAYSRDLIVEGETWLEDYEFEKEETTEIAGYEVKIQYKPDTIWLDWNDENYKYTMQTNDPEIGKDGLIRMAESIYEKK